MLPGSQDGYHTYHTYILTIHLQIHKHTITHNTQPHDHTTTRRHKRTQTYAHTTHKPIDPNAQNTKPQSHKQNLNEARYQLSYDKYPQQYKTHQHILGVGRRGGSRSIQICVLVLLFLAAASQNIVVRAPQI